MVEWEKKSIQYMNKLRRGRTETTLRSIKNRLYMFKKFIGTKDITYDLYEKYLTWAFENYSHTTVQRSHKELKRFFKFIKHPVYDEIQFYRIPEKLPPIKTLNTEQLNIIMEWCKKQTGFNWKHRCSIYLMLLATSGIRAGEAIRLKWSNWDKDKSMFHLEDTKTGISRLMAYSPSINPYLERWRHQCESNNPNGSMWVLPSLKMINHHVDYRAIQQKIKQYLVPKFGFHFSSKVFRSTMVQRVIDFGGRYEEASAIVGHKDIGVTQRYYARIKMNKRAHDAHSRAIKDIF